MKLLSGGNQQKAILARWLLTEPRRAAHPRRADPRHRHRRKFEIAKLMDSSLPARMSILFISSELEEVVRSCRRVVVLRDRHKVAELTGERISEQNIMSTIAGAR